jgi:hypothetical protein
MKLQVLHDLQQDINRLFIAGSKFAKGDPRLQKHVPTLNRLGEKAPVFKKLASGIKTLLQTDERQSADCLTSLSVLLYSVLYTQGETVEEDAATEPLTPFLDTHSIQTSHSYLELKPIIAALTTAASGRVEILEDAFKRNVFTDSRLHPYLDFALADKYSVLCDYVEQTVIPSVGAPMIPHLLRGFRYEDKVENQRRLRLLSRLEYKDITTMTEKIFSESLPALQAGLIPALAEQPENEDFIIQLAADRNKTIREAAYIALARYGTVKSLERLKEAHDKAKNETVLQAIVNALSLAKSLPFLTEIMDRITMDFNEFVSLDKTADDKLPVGKLNAFITRLPILKNKGSRQVADFLARLLTDKAYRKQLSGRKKLLENPAANVSRNIGEVVKTFDENEALAFYTQNFSKIPDEYWKEPLWTYYFEAAAKVCEAKKLYALFKDALRKGFIREEEIHWLYDMTKTRNSTMDSRWLDVMHEHLSKNHSDGYYSGILKSLSILDETEPADCTKFNKLLVQFATNTNNACFKMAAFRIMLKRNVPNRFQIILNIIEKTKYPYSYTQNDGLNNNGFWTQFPLEYADKLRKLSTKEDFFFLQAAAHEIEQAHNT